MFALAIGSLTENEITASPQAYMVHAYGKNFPPFLDAKNVPTPRLVTMPHDTFFLAYEAPVVNGFINNGLAIWTAL